MAEKKKKQAPFGCLFWIAFILLVFTLFFINRNDIAESLRKLETSGFFNKKTEDGATPDLTPRTKDGDNEIHLEIPDASQAESAAASRAQDARDAQNTQDSSNSQTESHAEREDGADSGQAGETSAQASGALTDGDSALQKPDDLTELTAPGARDGGSAAQDSAAERDAGGSAGAAGSASAQGTAGTRQTAGSGEPVQMRAQRLYFVSVDSDGRVIRQEVLRDIPRSDSPLADALLALFAGPSEVDANQGLRSLIPAGTRLLSATVRNGTATLNLSEEFQFNQFGIEGYWAQLSQIVFTATTFPTVTAVQFLIDGQKRDYLAESVWIGTPLGRKEFSN